MNTRQFAIQIDPVAPSNKQLRRRVLICIASAPSYTCIPPVQNNKPELSRKLLYCSHLLECTRDKGAEMEQVTHIPTSQNMLITGHLLITVFLLQFNTVRVQMDPSSLIQRLAWFRLLQKQTLEILWLRRFTDFWISPRRLATLSWCFLRRVPLLLLQLQVSFLF